MIGERESLTFAGDDPVAHSERLLEIVTAPTGDAARFFASTEGAGSAWISRAEAEELVGFLRAWLARTA